LLNEINTKLTSNYIHGVKDIKIKYEFSSSKLILKFETEDVWLIEDAEIYVILVDPTELRMFEWYHLMEPTNLKLKSLSTIELSDYNHLSDVYCLSGVDSLAFKYSEEDVYNQTDYRYYYPGYNTKFPLRFCDVFE
jgi:hypothetical protein